MKTKNTVLIFGAGASYDSGFNGPEYMLPLSTNLFDDQTPVVKAALADFTSLVGQLPAIQREIKNKFSGNVEAFLDALIKTGKNPSLVRDIFWFIQSLMLKQGLPTGGNYRKFMHRLWEIEGSNLHLSSIVNFNYDQMLDEVIKPRLGLSTNMMEYLQVDPKYIKPHGSADWYELIHIEGKSFNHLGNQDEARKNKINASQKILLSRAIEPDRVLVGDGAGIHQLLGNMHDSAIPVPAIVLPVITKVIASDMFPALAEALEHSIDEADHIILVGYRGSDLDFRGCIKKRTESERSLVVSVIGVNDASAVLQDVFNIAPDRLSVGFCFTGGFSRAVQYLRWGRCRISKGLLKIHDYKPDPKDCLEVESEVVVIAE